MRSWSISLAVSFAAAALLCGVLSGSRRPHARPDVARSYSPGLSNAGADSGDTAAPRAAKAPSAPGYADLDTFLQTIRAKAVASPGAPVGRMTFAGASGAHPLSLATLTTLEARCASGEPETVLTSIARTESRLRPYVIHVNAPHVGIYDPTSREDADTLVRRLTALGWNFDVGLTQVNSRNFHALGVTAEDMLDPCKNLTAAARVLEAGYRQALHASLPGRSILETAYSYYNSGKADRGFGNGYTEAVRRQVRLEALR
jgi:type IV secretion system protein VirB1